MFGATYISEWSGWKLMKENSHSDLAIIIKKVLYFETKYDVQYGFTRLCFGWWSFITLILLIFIKNMSTFDWGTWLNNLLSPSALVIMLYYNVRGKMTIAKNWKQP